MRKVLKQLTGLVLIMSVLASTKDEKEDDKQSDKKDDEPASPPKDKKYLIDHLKGPKRNGADGNSQDANSQGGCSPQ